jgi:hypothetical protein
MILCEWNRILDQPRLISEKEIGVMVGLGHIYISLYLFDDKAFNNDIDKMVEEFK